MTPPDQASSGEWRRGWPVIAGSAVGMGAGITLFGQSSGFFVKPLAAAFGWSRGQISLTAAAWLLTSLAMPAMGVLIDRYSPRIFMMVGAGLFAAAYLALGAMPGKLWVFYLIFLILGLTAGPATAPLVFVRPLVDVFKRSRGLALSLGMSGGAILSIGVLPVLQQVIAGHGWRAGYLMMAPLALGFGVISFLMFGLGQRRKRADGVAATADSRAAEGVGLGAAMRDVRFWLLALAMIAANIAGGGFNSQLQPLLSDLKMPGVAAALLGSWYFATIVAGRLLTGVLLDRFWAPAVGCLALSGPAIGFLAFLHPHSIWIYGAGVALVGLAQGAEGDLLAYFTARYFGLKAFGAIFGVLGLCLGISLAIGEAAAGLSFDHFKSYEPVLKAGALLAMVGALSLLGSGLFGRKRKPLGAAAVDSAAFESIVL
jgi:MFS family permease